MKITPGKYVLAVVAVLVVASVFLPPFPSGRRHRQGSHAQIQNRVDHVSFLLGTNFIAGVPVQPRR